MVEALEYRTLPGYCKQSTYGKPFLDGCDTDTTYIVYSIRWSEHGICVAVMYQLLMISVRDSSKERTLITIWNIV